MPLAIVLFVLLAGSAARAQGIAATERRPLTTGDSVVVLAHDFLVPGTIGMLFDSVYVLRAPLDYSLDLRFGVVTFTPFFRRLLADTLPHSLSISYRYRPIDLPRDYARRRLVTIVDSAGVERSVARESSELTSSSIFGSNFRQSGGIVRGFTVGSNRDLSLQSRLWLQFSGKITDDVEVLGAVTDEQTPIQPEGNTQTLREVDNIFIEIRSPYVGGTVGKFSAANTSSEWTAFSRKLQGVKAIGRYGEYGTTEVVAAVSPGRFNTQLIAGRERDQGPYRLTGPSGERNIIVVAGTEKVFLDGVQMVRGESNDYVIDYGTGEIFFQTRRVITGASRITIDFEYSDRQYSRSFVSVANTGRLFDSALTITANFVREADNPDATIDITLNDADRALLAAAGSDRGKAVRSGVYLVGRTDTSLGSYYVRDTTIDGVRDSIYVYAPNDPRSVYAITFSVPPDGRGDYRNIAFGQYEFAGRGLGNYLPVVYLPLPQLRQIFSLGVGATPAPGVRLSSEVAYGTGSVNRFSFDPGAQQQGLALNARASARADTLLLAGLALRQIAFDGSVRYLDSAFQPIERLGDVEFGNRWNTRDRLGESRSNDLIAETNLSLYPMPRLEIAASDGLLKRGSLFTSFRQQYSARFLGDTLLPSADYTLEHIATTDSALGRSRGSWMKQRGGLSWIRGALIPGVRFEYENREDRAGTALTDTLYPSSFRFIEAGPEIQLMLPFAVATARARFRVEDSVRYDAGTGTGRFLRDGSSQTYTLRGEMRGVRDLSSTLDFTYRRRSYDSLPVVDQSRRLDNETILARSQTRWSPFDRAIDLDALYEVQTEQAARLQRVFVLVRFGQGQYVWVDLDSNGRQSEEEFRPALAGEGEYVRLDIPTEQLYPVIDLRGSFRVRLQPQRLLGDKTTLGRLLAPVTAETFLRIDEKSQSQQESDIYLLRLSHFQNDSTTIVGSSVVQQDVNLFQGNPDYSFRLRYEERRGLTRLVQTVERKSDRERSLRSRWQPTTDIGLTLDLTSSSSLLHSSDSTSTRTYDLSTLSAENDFSYRPEQALELGWTLRVASIKDVLPAIPRSALISLNRFRAVYSLPTRGSLRAELERTNVSGENLGRSELSLPYQLTEGYAIGVTWAGRLSFEYSFGRNIQATITYSGRAQPPTDRVVHTGQAELRAFF